MNKEGRKDIHNVVLKGIHNEISHSIIASHGVLLHHLSLIANLSHFLGNETSL